MENHSNGHEAALQTKAAPAQPASPPPEQSWWSRPCGARDVLYVAIPLVLSTLSWTIMSFIDRTFLTWYDTDAMAAAMPAGAVSFSAICLPMGIASYVGTFVAQYNGAKQYRQIGQIVWQGVWIGVASIPLCALLYGCATFIFQHVGHEQRLADLEIVYFQTLMYGAAGVVVSAALSGFFSGLQETKVVMCVTSLAAALNILLDYCWIFGHFGFAEHGIIGAGWATSLSEWTKAALYLALILWRDRDGQFGVLAGMRASGRLLRRLIWFGGPNGVQFFIEMTAFSAYLLLVGQLGRQEMAATSLAFNVNQLAFVPMLGLGMAVSILVGNQIGQQRIELAERAAWTTLAIAIAYSVFMAALYFLVPDLFLLAHRWGADGAEFEQVHQVTITLLRFVAVYCVFDAILIVFSNAIKGAGDTQFVMLAAIFLSPLPVIIGWAGIRYWEWGLIEFWYLVTFWILAQAVIYGSRFLQGKWRQMTVIEHE